MALLSLIVLVHPPRTSLVLETLQTSLGMSKRSRGIAQPSNSVWVLLSWAKVAQPSWGCDICIGMPSCLASSTCLNKKNVKIPSILLERWLQTSCSVGRQMGMRLPFAWCQYLKMLCQDPIAPATAQMEQKTVPTGKQSARQEATAMPFPRGQTVVTFQVGCQAHLQPCCSCAQGGAWGQTGKRRNEVALQVFTGSFSRGTRSRGENLNPRGPEDPVSGAGSLPQVCCSSLCTAQHHPKAGWCGLSRGCCALTCSFSAFVVGLNFCCLLLCWVS